MILHRLLGGREHPTVALDRIREEKEYLVSTASRFIRKNACLLAASAKRAKNHPSAPNIQKVNDYTRNARMLRALRDKITEHYSDPASMARQRCGVNAWMINPAHSDFDLLADELEGLDPEALYSPFRHALQLPVKTLKLLKLAWRTSKSRDRVTEYLASQYPPHSVAAGIVGRSRRIGQRIGWGEQELVNELVSVTMLQCYGAATALAVVLAEGLLWQFARHLNRRHVRIFKTVRRGRLTRHYAYPWDHSALAYENCNASGAPLLTKKCELHSARQLLYKTRLQEYFPLQVFNYLMVELMDDRNLVAHGSLKADANAALRSLLCLESLLCCIEAYLDERRQDDKSTTLSISEQYGTI